MQGSYKAGMREGSFFKCFQASPPHGLQANYLIEPNWFKNSLIYLYLISQISKPTERN